VLVEGKLELIGKYCVDHGLPYEEYNKTGQYLFHEKSLAEKSRFIKYGRAHSFLGKLEDVCVFGDGFIVTADANVFVHGLNYRNYHLDIDDYLVSGSGNHVNLNIPDIKGECVEKVVLIWGGSNFAHWLFEYLPRLAVAACNDELKEIAYVITDDMPSRYVEFMLATGISKEQIIVVEQGATYFFKELWVPSVVAYRGHYSDNFPYLWPEAIRYLRSHICGEGALISRPSKNIAKRIYISRRSAEWRKPTNEDDVISCLRQYGVEDIDMNGMVYEQQIDYVKNAELIVVAGGGASPITMYAPLECVIIELAPTHVVGTWGSMAWAHVLGQHFQRLVCESEEQTRDSNYHVDIKTLQDYVIRAEEILYPKQNFYQELYDKVISI
jgi:hypothetical protein